MASPRVYITAIAIDAVGNPDVISIPSDWPPLRSVKLSESTGNLQWLFYAPYSNSQSKTVFMGQELPFSSVSHYAPGDIIGYAALASGSGTLIMTGEG